GRPALYLGQVFLSHQQVRLGNGDIAFLYVAKRLKVNACGLKGDLGLFNGPVKIGRVERDQQVSGGDHIAFLDGNRLDLPARLQDDLTRLGEFHSTDGGQRAEFWLQLGGRGGRTGSRQCPCCGVGGEIHNVTDRGFSLRQHFDVCLCGSHRRRGQHRRERPGDPVRMARQQRRAKSNRCDQDAQQCPLGDLFHPTLLTVWEIGGQKISERKDIKIQKGNAVIENTPGSASTRYKHTIASPIRQSKAKKPGCSG